MHKRRARRFVTEPSISSRTRSFDERQTETIGVTESNVITLEYSDTEQVYAVTEQSEEANTRSLIPGYNVKSFTAELERRRIELIALVRIAEARARDADEQRNQIEAKLDQETAQRQLFAQRIQDLDDHYRQKLSEAQAEHERKKAEDEARLHQEIELRVSAEKKLIALEDELSTFLELDWSKIDPKITQIIPTPDSASAQEAISQLQAQIESELQARLRAEKACAAAEATLVELKSKHLRTEAGFKHILRKQEAELRALSEQVNRARAPSAANAVVKSVEEDYTQNRPEQLAMRTRIKLVGYIGVIILLLFALCFLIVTIFI